MNIMTNNDLIARMKELHNEPNRYGSGGNQWSTFQKGGYWYVDCTCSIKAILWGGRFIAENRNKAHAGCKYKSNNVPDFTPSSCVKWINAIKGNFVNLVPGEIVLMTTRGHAGLYIGNGEVLEVTPAWTGGNPGCQISKIGANGERIKNGKQVYSWEYHGKIPGIDYIIPAPAPTPTPTLTPGTNKYVVQAGDTLSGIGSRFGIDWKVLYDANRGVVGPNPNLIRVGQVLTIPGSTPAPEPVYYVVKPGDSLSKIAAKFGKQWQKIYSDNRAVIGTNPNRIMSGQRLVIK